MKNNLCAVILLLLTGSPALALDSAEYVRMLSPHSANSQMHGVVTRGITGETVELGVERNKQNQQMPEVAMNLQFDLGSSRLTPQARRELLQLAKALQDPSLRDSTFTIEGHTCDRGSASANLRLSRNRARSVTNFLMENSGLYESQFDVTGYGESSPLIPNTDEASRQRNRRVVIRNTMQKKTAPTSEPIVQGAGGTSAGGAAVAMQIYRYTNQRNELLHDGESLHSGEHYSLSFTPGEHRYAYVCQMDSAGAVNLLFPDFSVQKNPLRPRKSYHVPGNGKYFTLDSTVGKEEIVLLTLDTALPNPKTACKKAFKNAGIAPQLATRGVGGIAPLSSQHQKQAKPKSSQPLSMALCDAEEIRTRGVGGVKRIDSGSNTYAENHSACHGNVVSKFFIHQ